MATIRVKNPSLGGEKWITIPTKILSEADHIVTNKGQGDLYLSNDGTYKDVIKSANDYTDKLIELITGSSPDILETLKELSNQTSDNKDFINVLNKSIATKLDKTANAVSASKLATPIKLWGNDFDGSLSVYGNLCAPNGNLGLGINANNVVLGNNTNPSYIYGSSVMFKTGTDAVAAYISPDGKVGIGTANPLVGFHVNVNSYFDYPIKVSGTVDYSSPLLKLDATNTNNNGLLVLSKLGNSKAAIGIDDTQGMWFLNLSNSNIFRITSNSLIYGSNKIWHEGNFNPSDYLPLSGGTVTGVVQIIDSNVAPFIVNTNTVAAGIQLMSSSGSGYFLYYGDKDYYVTSNNWTNKYKIWHEGNDGADSGLDADTLDGLHSGNFAKSLMDVGANNTKSNVLGYTYGTEAHGGASAGGLISAGMGTYGMQLNGAYNGNKLSFRGFSPDGYTDWKTIAFTDYNGFYDLYHNKEIPENANLNDYKNVGTYSTRNNNIALTISNRPFNDAFKLCVEQTIDENTLLQKAVRWFDGQTKVRHMSNNNWGNWYMISTDLSKYNAPTASKLQTPVKLWGNDFDGSNSLNGFMLFANNSHIYMIDTAGNESSILVYNSSNDLALGYGSCAKGHLTRIYGAPITFFTGTDRTQKMFIGNNGNVGIGTTDPQYKLDVKGNVVFSGSLRAGSIYCTGIESGDYVDWYGVSWSEGSSDPTCTRIGNMALHRSLPILNAMKGYIFGNSDDSKDSCIPLNDEWTAAKYSFHNHTFPQLESNNRMIKIPEFWYIDDYEPLTKTHNLKISQTAKAGWCHHKEAYVGAYEGYSDGTHYRSQKGKIPTVSVSRTTLRPLARANGYENEYKWNIYTYEEHRAICHLFLVEYATRNSQLAVNTELTADGFKQGGLGSGCTTGTVTINGVATYSFIPTGTTDSLGNGSGQVAYTVTQTDADGNEIGTVTRYANRYRGIENPFGHIWKHVDDIVNIYNAETTYKTVYKCNKPEHFATNKNAKYKPLCSFPGGSKMQGWSKEIKATINCDFFKYSVGSESTYWCDYNYDNDDTTEHCLLIGGGSGNGGGAGLFYLNLHAGVGHSAAYVGSRLTYLPWAE